MDHFPVHGIVNVSMNSDKSLHLALFVNDQSF